MNGKYSRRGFTLIEMLVVMAITALLLSIAVPRYFGAIDKSKTVTLRHNLKAMRASIDQYYADKGKYPGTLDELVEHQYLKTVPVDPVSESAGTWQLIQSVDASAMGITDVRSGSQGIGSDGTPYAEY